MATTDLQALYWPPISELWQYLFSLRNGAAATAAASAEHEQLLQRYSRWLAQAGVKSQCCRPQQSVCSHAAKASGFADSAGSGWRQQQTVET